MSDPGSTWLVRRPDGSISAEFYGADAEINAKFSAAAGELYEALCAAVLDLNRLDSETQTEVESAGGKYNGLRSLRMAEAALAKAEGRE